MESIIRKYRGFEILHKEGSYLVPRLRNDIGFNTAWSAMTYIDEFLQP